MEARDILMESMGGSISDKAAVKVLVEKWAEFLEGMPNRSKEDQHKLGVMALVYENQANWLSSMTEETRTANVGSFTKYIFPTLRRVVPNLIANEIVSVQPLTAPTGAVFYLDYVYDTNKGATIKGNVFPRDFDRDFSSENINGEILVTGDGLNYGGGGTALSAGLSYSPVRPLNAAQGFSVIVREINVTTGATVQEATDNGSGGFTGNVTAGTINYSNGQIAAFKFTAPPAASNPVKVFYSYDSELSPKIGAMKLDVKQAPVQVTTRKLKTTWSAEAAEDLRAFHGADAEAELVSVAAQDIALEMDREVINDLYAASTGTTATWDRVPPAGIAEHDHFRSLLTPISSVSAQIHRKTLRAPANFIVTSPDVSALLQQLTTHTDFRPAFVSGDPQNNGMDLPRPLTSHGQYGVYKVGTLQNKWTLYEDPFFARDRMLIGLKGSSYLDAGYAWCPYVALQVTPTFLDPSDMSYRKGLRTRYARKVLRPDYYAQLRVLNL